MGVMSESGTRLERAELDVDKAQAILEKVEQVLQAVGKVQAAPEGTRVLIRAATIMIVGGVALFGVAVVVARVKH
jgi:hypothetical protein